MKFLIDECLHTSLVGVATARNYEAYHVSWLGLSGTADRDLMPRITEGDFIFATNNARDFRRLFDQAEIHAGLVILLPCVPPDQQVDLFERVLDALAQEPDPVNQAIEVYFEGDEIVIDRYDLPKDN